MQITPFQAEDFHLLVPQPAQAWVRDVVTSAELRDAQGPNSCTAWVDGEPMWCFGWFEVCPTRAVVWTFMSANAGPHFTAIHREAKARIEALPHRRVETTVDWDFDAGHRWVRMLGFDLEHPRLRAYRADGGDSALYARVK